MWTQSAHCTDRDLLMAVDGELPARRLVSVDAHLAACAGCRQRRDQIHSTLLETTSLCRADDEVAATFPRDGRARLEHALRAVEGEPSSWLSLIGAAWRPFASAAVGVGTIAAAILTAFLVSPRATPGETSAPLPVATTTPGAVSGLTALELCSGVRPSRLVAAHTRLQVLRAYKMEQISATEYELDALVTPELGGTTDPANLWPQRRDSPIWNARVKDELERLLPTLVCRHQLELAQAQRDLSGNWIAAYKKYFKTDAPLQAHVGPPLDEDDELVFSPAETLLADARLPIGVNLRHRSLP